MITKKLLHAVFLAALTTCMLCKTASAATVSQTIELNPGWNLISLSVDPVDANVANVFSPLGAAFESVWQYNAVAQSWQTYQPVPIAGVDSFSTIATGQGYWVKVTSHSTLVIAGNDVPAGGQIELYPGWNLVGFTAATEIHYNDVLNNVPYTQLWTYDSLAGLAGEFIGIEIAAGSGTVLREEFKLIQPGRAYWVLATEQTTVGPELATALPGDIDVPPLLTHGQFGEAVLWSDLNVGDQDIGNDGYYDFSNTQRSISFNSNLVEQEFTIINAGTGVLNWQATILNPGVTPWLSLQKYDEELQKNIQLTEITGSQTRDTYRLAITADRGQLAPGDYYGQIEITSNGNAALAEQTSRIINVHMNVATIVGEYDVQIMLETVRFQGQTKQADMHNPRMFLSISEVDGDIKGVFDERQTLLMPKRFYLTGSAVQNNSNDFSLSGSISLPARESGNEGANFNPYNVDLQREITLLGHRSANPGVSPLDLEGQYFETVRNVLDEPIYIEGSFRAVYKPNATVTTDEVIARSVGDAIPDQNPESTKLVSKIIIDDPLLISDIDVTVNLSHTRATDLIVTLTSPELNVVRLRENNTDPLGKVTYDTDIQSIDSMQSFNGEIATGDWILTIEDSVPLEVGSLIEWSLNIRGTPVYNITGTLAGVPDGTQLLLTGCGVTRIATVVNEEYTFSNLINCRYQITLLHPGYLHSKIIVEVNGAHVTGAVANLPVERRYSSAPDFNVAPLSGLQPLEIELIDTTNLAPGTQWVHRWTISRWENNAPQPYLELPGTSFHERYTLTEPGVYTVKMDIFDATNLVTPVHSVDKANRFIFVGQNKMALPLPLVDLSYDAQRIFSSYTTSGAGGHTGNANHTWHDHAAMGIDSALPLIYANDSATFDIDRPSNPLSDGSEDSNHFTGVEDVDIPNENYIGTHTNKLGDNTTLDAHVGSGQAYRIFVNTGQPIIGSSIRANRRLEIGHKP